MKSIKTIKDKRQSRAKRDIAFNLLRKHPVFANEPDYLMRIMAERAANVAADNDTSIAIIVDELARIRGDV